MTENKPTVEHETWIRVRNCSDIIRVIVEDDQSTSYLFTLDKTKHTTIGSFCSHLCKVLQKKTNLNYLLLLYPCHHIQDVNALQTGDQLKLTTTIHYNTLISERKRSMNQQYQTIHPRTKNGVMDASDINGDSNNDDSSTNNFSSGIIAPSYFNGNIPHLIQSSNKEINGILFDSTSEIVNRMSNSLQTNFDLSAVDIRGIMVSNKLVEVVSNAAKIMNVDLKCCQKIGENCVILKCKESECSFKLIYRKYSDNTFMLYASILVHSHVKSVKPQRNFEAPCDDASLTIPQNSDKNDYSNNANKENSNSLDINELDFTENLDINQMNENNELIKGCEEDKEMEDDDGDEMLNLSIDKKERSNEVNNKLVISIKEDTNKCNDASITTMASEIQNSKEEKEIKRGEILNDESSADKIKEMYRDPTIDDEPDLNDSDVELYLEAQDMACSQNSIDCTNPIKSSKKSHKKFSTDPYGNEIDEDEKS